MKKLFLTLTVVGLVACNSTGETTSTECCHTTDATDLPFEIDSIQNVGQLLDSLEAVPPKNL